MDLLMMSRLRSLITYESVEESITYYESVEESITYGLTDELLMDLLMSRLRSL